MAYLLVLFDGLSLAADGAVVPPVALERRRLALLAVLALGGERGLARETVEAYLWPEGAADHARHGLDDLLETTGRDLGRDAVLAGPGELRLNPAVFDVDVWRFELAVRERRWSDAVAERTGPLLNGVHIVESAAGERWLDGERTRLDRLHGEALVRLAAVQTGASTEPPKRPTWRRLGSAGGGRIAAAGLLVAAAAGVAATRYADRPLERDRMRLEAFRAESLGDGETAERHYRAIVDRHPDDAESWLRLGEVLFHLGPLYGQPVAAAAEPFGRVLALDPTNAEAVLHLARLAALDGRDADFDSLAARHRAIAGGATDQAGELHAAGVVRRGMGATIGLASELRDATVARRYGAVRSAAVYGDDLATTARLARAITDGDASPETRALGHVLEAYLAVARGRLDDARTALGRAQAIDPLLAAEYGSLLAAAPFLPPHAPALLDPTADSAAWRARLARPDAHPAAHDAPALALHHAVHAQIRLAALGLAAARRGDAVAAGAYADAVAALPAVDRVPSLTADLAASVRAHAAARAGRPGAALRLLESAPVRAPMAYADDSPLYARAHDRFLRAELLLAAGRPREALGWYASFGGDSFFDLPYLAPAQRRLGEIYLRLGDAARARAHLQRFTALWAEADPVLQPQVVEALARSGGLGP